MKIRFSVITLSIVAVIAAVYSCCFFVIPFGLEENYSVFFVTYCATILLLAAIFGISCLAFCRDSLKLRVIGVTIFMSVVITFLVQILADIIFYVVGSYLAIRMWVVIIIECFIFGALIIALVALINHRRFIERNDYTQNKSTDFIFTLRKEYLVISKTDIPQVRKQLNRLYEAVLYTDPVSTDIVTDVEVKIKQKTDELKEQINRCDTTKILAIIEELVGLIRERQIKLG